MGSNPLRTTTLRSYLRETTELRVSADATERLAELVGVQLEQIAGRARELTLAAERNTLLDRDVEEAFDGWLKDAGPSLLSSAALLATLNGLSNEALTDLIQQLQAQLKP
tara:strand:- start:82 stop:411 length:330 start_codon:yes stop_codon:yes gene_type:complete